jgi:hypothetical protein
MTISNKPPSLLAFHMHVCWDFDVVTSVLLVTFSHSFISRVVLFTPQLLFPTLRYVCHLSFTLAGPYISLFL